MQRKTAEIEADIKATEERIASGKSAIAENPDSNRAAMLRISLSTLESDLKELKAELDASRNAPQTPVDEEQRLRDMIEKDEELMRKEEDGVRRSGLEIEMRGYQMELNRLLVSKTDAETGNKPAEEPLDDHARLMEALERMERLQSEVAYLRATVDMLTSRLGGAERRIDELESRARRRARPSTGRR